jgi:hypothetical protein
MSVTPPGERDPYTGPVAKLDTAETFERVGSVYSSQFPVLLGVAVAVYLPLTLLDALLAKSGSVVLLLSGLVVAVVGGAIYTAAVVEAVVDMRDGRRGASVPQLLRTAIPFILPLILGAILYLIALLVGFVLLVVPMFIFGTWFSLYAPVCVVERQGIVESFSRSRRIVRGNAWRVLGVLVVTFVILLVVGGLIRAIVAGGSDDYARVLIASLANSLITGPVVGIVLSTLYFQLRDMHLGTSGFSGPAPTPRV